MKKNEISKSLQKQIKKSADKFIDNMYFNPQRREKMRKLFVESQENFMKVLEEPLGLNSTLEKVKDKVWAETFMDHTTTMIDLIDNVVPRKLKEMELTKCSFKMYKKTGSKFIAIKCSYKKGVPKKHHESCLLIPLGFPQKGKRTKVQLIRGKYKLKSFELVDQGTFTQKLKSFKKAEQTFFGKKAKIKFELTQRGKVKDDNWLKLK